MAISLTDKNMEKQTTDYHWIIVEQVSKLIEPLTKDSPLPQTNVYVIAAIAFSSEMHRLPSFQEEPEMGGKIKMENVLPCIPEAHRECYLDALADMMMGQQNCPHGVKDKLQKLRTVSRLFHKYTALSQIVSDGLTLPKGLLQCVSVFIWALFIYSKQTLKISANQIPPQQLLLNILHSILTKKLSFISSSQLEKHFTDLFNQSFPTQNQIKITDAVETILAQFDESSCLTLYKNSLMQDSQLRQSLGALLTKIRQDYHRIKQANLDEFCLVEFEVDQTVKQFLQTVIANYQKQEGLKNEENSQEKTADKIREDGPSGSKKKQSAQKSPKPSRLKVLGWVQNSIELISRENIIGFELAYLKYNKTLNFSEWKKNVSHYIEAVIVEFSPNCRNGKKREKNIYGFFMYFMVQLQLMYDQKQIQLIFRDHKSLDAVLCLVTELFNFCYQALGGRYRRYCEIFELDCFYGFRPINWLGRFMDLPEAVSDHLYEVERKFVVKEIWEDDAGYHIITNEKESVSINEMAIYKRIQHHIYLRISQIVKDISLPEKIIFKIYSMVFSIISNKPHLLQQNNLDQIIICSITGCLSINELNHNISLEKVVEYYEATTKEKLYNREMREISIIEFYNEVFLSEIDDIIRQKPQTADFLLTPNRIARKQKLIQGLAMTPLKDKFSEPVYQPNISRNTIIQPPKYSLSRIQFDFKNHQNSPINSYNFPKVRRSMKFDEELKSLAEEEQEEERAQTYTEKPLNRIRSEQDGK